MRILLVLLISFVIIGCTPPEETLHRNDEAISEEIKKLNTEAGELMEQKKAKEAIAKQEEARALVSEYFMVDDPFSLQVLNNLAGLYYQSGDIDGAIEVSEAILKALSESEREVSGKKYMTVITSLAQMHESKGNYTRAEELLMEVLRIMEKQKIQAGQEDVLNKLATFNFNQKEYREARIYYEKLLTFKEGILGEGSPKLAKTYKNIAMFYRLIGHVQRADELEKKITKAAPQKRGLKFGQ